MSGVQAQVCGADTAGRVELCALWADDYQGERMATVTPEATNVVVAVLGAIVGAILGGGSVLVVIGRILAKVKSDPITLDYIEKLYQSIPIDAMRELLRNAAVVADKVTDGAPNVVGEPGSNG